jgi:hypothetical protein
MMERQIVTGIRTLTRAAAGRLAVVRGAAARFAFGRAAALAIVAGAVAAGGCDFAAHFDSTGLQIRLEGTISLGPTAPVCRVGQPCDGPFVGTFVVRQGALTVARFTTDSTGAFSVRLAPGSYVVAPTGNSFLAAQERPVTVGTDSVTVVHLDFDTGIR